MKTVKPDYYDKFICAADRCSYTCCQQWDIYVDEITRQKWRTLAVPPELTQKVTTLTDCIDGDCICFGPDRRCRLLTESGLCRMVLTYGEESIPDTCHVFPRERHVYGDRTEYALSPECPQVLRLLLEGDNFTLVSKETGKEKADRETSDRLFSIRDRLLEIMTDPVYAGVDTGVLLTAELILLHDALKAEGEIYSDDSLRKVIDAVMAASPSQAGYRMDSQAERNELLMDSLTEYRDQGRYTDFTDGMMEAAVRWQNALKDPQTAEKTLQSEEETADCKQLLKRLAAEEIYASLLPVSLNAAWETKPAGGRQNRSAAYTAAIRFMIIKLEWLIMACSNIRQCLMLRRTGDLPCGKEDLVETVVIIMRIMGFADDDIMEYMESEFEDAVWPIEYALLLI